jgi:hypothetical protein
MMASKLLIDDAGPHLSRTTLQNYNVWFLLSIVIFPVFQSLRINRYQHTACINPDGRPSLKTKRRSLRQRSNKHQLLRKVRQNHR